MKFHVGQKLKMLKDHQSHGKGEIVYVVKLQELQEIGEPETIETDGSWGWKRSAFIPTKWQSRTGKELYWNVNDYNHATGWEEVIEEVVEVVGKDGKHFRVCPEEEYEGRKWKEGDWVMLKRDCFGLKKGDIECLYEECLYEKENKLWMGKEEGSRCHCQELWTLLEEVKEEESMWEVKVTVEDLEKLKSKSLISKCMSDIKTFAKNLLLSVEEKLLRKYGLKTECGDYTQEAVEICQQDMCKQNEEKLVEIAKAKEEEEKKK